MNATFLLFDMVAGRKGITSSVNKKYPGWVLLKISSDWWVRSRILIQGKTSEN